MSLTTNPCLGEALKLVADECAQVSQICVRNTWALDPG